MKLFIYISGFLGLTLAGYLTINSNSLVHARMVKTNQINPDTTYAFSDSSLIDQFTMTFTSAYNHSTPVLSSQNTYSMVISGSFYAALIRNGIDAAYYYCYYSCPFGCNTTIPCYPPLTTSIITTLRPTVDTFRLDHTYYYNFTGADTAMVFQFTDTQYGDNGGSLDITIYEQPKSTGFITMDSTDLYLRDPMSALILTSPDSTCYRITVDNTGALVSTPTTCP